MDMIRSQEVKEAAHLARDPSHILEFTFIGSKPGLVTSICLAPISWFSFQKGKIGVLLVSYHTYVIIEV